MIFNMNLLKTTTKTPPKKKTNCVKNPSNKHIKNPNQTKSNHNPQTILKSVKTWTEQIEAGMLLTAACKVEDCEGG